MKNLRTGLIILLVVASLVGFYEFIFAPLVQHEADLEICGAKHYLRTCYNMNRKACETIWNSTEKICHERHLAKLNKVRPGVFAGPATQKCREYEFHRVANFMASQSTDESCVGLRSRISEYEPPPDDGKRGL